MNTVTNARYDSLILRAGPGSTFAATGSFRLGQSAEVTGRSANGDWWRVRVPHGAAWISKYFVVFAGDLATVPVITDGGATPTPGPTGQATPHPTATPTATSTPAPTDKVIYLTFDDGPLAPFTDQLLDLLAQNDARATFFSIGQNAERYPDRIDRIVTEGHTLGNHTWSHPSLTTLSRDRIVFEITRAAQAYHGRLTRKLLRPPYGATNAFVRALTAELGYQTVLWTIDTVDWQRPGAQAIVNTVLRFARPQAIALFHDGGGERGGTIRAIAQLLPALKSLGYRCAAL